MLLGFGLRIQIAFDNPSTCASLSLVLRVFSLPNDVSCSRCGSQVDLSSITPPGVRGIV